MENTTTPKLMRPYEVIDYLRKFMPFSRMKLFYYLKHGAIQPIADISFAGKRMNLFTEGELLRFLEKLQRIKDIDKAFGYVPRDIRKKVFSGEVMNVDDLSGIVKHYPSWTKRKQERRLQISQRNDIRTSHTGESPGI